MPCDSLLTASSLQIDLLQVDCQNLLSTGLVYTAKNVTDSLQVFNFAVLIQLVNKLQQTCVV